MGKYAWITNDGDSYIAKKTDGEYVRLDEDAKAVAIGMLNEHAELKEKAAELSKRIDDAMRMSNGRWCEWGERAEAVLEILEGGE